MTVFEKVYDRTIRAKEKIEILHDYMQSNPEQDVAKVINDNHLLVYAGKYGMLDEVIDFIMAGADVNDKNEAGETLLMQLAYGNYFKMAFILLHYPNLDVQAKCARGLTAIEYASDERIVSIIQEYIENNEWNEVLISALEDGNSTYIESNADEDARAVIH